MSNCINEKIPEMGLSSTLGRYALNQLTRVEVEEFKPKWTPKPWQRIQSEETDQGVSVDDL